MACYIHMYPEEAIQAAQDAKVEKVMAVHWAGFKLAQHTWQEPIERFSEAAQIKLTNLTPQVGELCNYSENFTERWWS